MMSRLTRWFLALSGVLLLAAQVARAADPVKPTAPAAGTNKPGKPAAETTPSNDILNVGDRVKVIFSDIPGAVLPQETQIPDSGELTLHLGHKFMFKGKRRDALEQEIRDHYIEKGIYRIINVTIEVPPRPISVGGEVRTPGNYPHSGQLTVLKVIDMAGGFTEYAKKSKVKILRAGKTITVDCKKALEDPEKHDVSIFPGDKVQVPRSLL